MKNQTSETDDEKKEDKVNIKDIFDPNEITETSQGYKTICPDCGLQGGRTEGFILFPDSNMAYCHSSGKHFTLLEAYALKKKIIKCLDGRDTGDKSTKVLGGELFTLSLDEFKNEYGTDTYNKLIKQLNIRKSIELPGNNRYLSDFSDEIGDVYKTRNVLFYRGALGKIYEIHRYPAQTPDGTEYRDGGFREVTANRFISLAEMFVKPWTTIFTKSGTSMTVNKSMTNTMAGQALDSPNFQNKIPTVVRLFDIQIPALEKGKLTFPKKGYDKRFESWLPYNAPQIKENMFTVEEAKDVINKIFEEFCFASEKDRIHAIAAFLTPFLRGLFPKFSTRTPVFIYMANRERAGKDYCAGCSGMLYEGVNVEHPAISNDEKNSNSNEEIRKKITACMIQGRKRFHSANNKGLLNNSVLEGVTTAEKWEDRELGHTRNVTLDNEMDFSLSGNLGIRLTPDLANRARIVNLHLVDEDANARVFKNPNLHEWIFKNRGMIISALYTLVKKWVDDGMPPGSVPFTSFPHWAAICGGIMESAGYENPCKADKTAIITLDNETEEMKQLFETGYKNHPDEWLSKNEIQSIVENESIMSYLDFNNKGDQTKFGMKIDRFTNRILSEIIMTVDSLEQRSSRRKYKFTKNCTIFTGVNGTPKNIEVERNGNLGNLEKKEYSNVEVERKKEVERKDVEVERICEKVDRNDQKVGNPGNFGIPSLLLPNSLIEMADDKQGVTKVSKVTTEIIPPKITQKLASLDEYSKKFNEVLKKEAEEKKEKSDRELQFYESPETSDIVEQCTKEQVLNWIKSNPKVSFQSMDEVLGIGCLKYVGELIIEGVIRPIGDGWEISN